MISKCYTILIVFFIAPSLLFSQVEGSFTMEVSSDTVLMGNTISLSYSLENMEGKFKEPDLSDFRVVAGPNVSSQFSSINGKSSSRISYTYYLMPKEEGVSTIGSAKIEDNNETRSLESAQITVIENPHGEEKTLGSSLIQKNNVQTDTLSERQKSILSKLKNAKRKKI